MSKSPHLVAALAVLLTIPVTASVLAAQDPPRFRVPQAEGSSEPKAEGTSEPQAEGAQEQAPAKPQEPGTGPQKSQSLDELIKQRPQIPTDNREGRTVRLSLSDCLRIGGESNIDLRVTRFFELIARQDITAAKGLYDVEFFLEGNWRRSESPARSSFQPSSTTKYTNLLVGLRKRFLSGATVEFGYGPDYTDQQVNSTFAFPDRFYGGDLNLALRQPLLRGAWWDYNEADIQRAAYEYAARQHDVESDRQTILVSIARAYYDLAFARENWIVSYKALELARQRLRNTESRIRFGEVAPRDRIADEAEVARKQEELILAETTILDAEDSLRRLVLGFGREDDWEVILLPTVDLSKGDPEIVLPAWRDAAFVARKNRPDVHALMQRVESALLLQRQADQDQLPQLDFLAAYGASAQRDEFGDWNSDLWGAEYPAYSLGFEFSLPLGNRVAEARFEQARLDARRLQMQLQILHIDIIRDVRAAIRRLERLEKSIAAAEESVRLARSNLEAEQTRLRHDSTTQFEVQERANELSEAASRLIRSRLDYRQAWFELLAVQGTLDEHSRLPGLDEDGSGSPETGGEGK